MKRILIVAALALASGSAFAELDPVAAKQLDDIRNGRDNANQILTLRVKDAIVLPAGSVDAADLASSSVASAEIVDGTIVNADVATGAAIVRSKLNLGGVAVTNTIVSGDAKTNVIITIDGVITAWTITQ